VRWFLIRHVTEKRAYGGQPKISTARADPTVGFQVIKKTTDQGRINRINRKFRRLFSKLLPCVLKQQAKGIAIGGNRMGAGLPLPHQPFRKKTFQERSK
jgi:hypothetical protein